jgi:hypothetical protein
MKKNFGMKKNFELKKNSCVDFSDISIQWKFAQCQRKKFFQNFSLLKTFFIIHLTKFVTITAHEPSRSGFSPYKKEHFLKKHNQYQTTSFKLNSFAAIMPSSSQFGISLLSSFSFGTLLPLLLMMAPQFGSGNCHIRGATFGGRDI